MDTRRTLAGFCRGFLKGHVVAAVLVAAAAPFIASRPFDSLIAAGCVVVAIVATAALYR